VSKNGVLGIEGSLFVVAIGPIVDEKKKSFMEKHPPIRELAVDQGNDKVTVGSLTQKFVISYCPTLGGKPKIFIFINTGNATDNASTSTDRQDNLAEVYYLKA
jgi:hypothetical protein